MARKLHCVRPSASWLLVEALVEEVVTFLVGTDVRAFAWALRSHRPTMTFVISPTLWTRLLTGLLRLPGVPTPTSVPAPRLLTTYATAIDHATWLRKHVHVIHATLDDVDDGSMQTLVFPTTAGLRHPPRGSAAAAAHAIAGEAFMDAEVQRVHRRPLLRNTAWSTSGGVSTFSTFLHAIGPATGDTNKLEHLAVTYDNVWAEAAALVARTGQPLRHAIGVLPIGMGLAQCPLAAAATRTLAQLSISAFEMHALVASTSVTFVCKDKAVFDAIDAARQALLQT
ncbi:hypothetical protein SPRG_04684 [Saprolegnia parasitica CBS 223.65]|uniref:Macro domain-containing protein n=1 Tax=Saprolegnia parasitica (strain CBS 223.65) TaxID=695850 RepID=A0A067CJW3_SAPPC|nr:hypothetical protein SPRG_04684 [Saprolegnia parasitica CBS 223.65]KDO30783.1 hypothetical protein SPRG_04684 [Saprolegnia parasitica CBS 223.65]|eukprot:XP_012198481.1 hypothetical protein SPRG_04684 [Saprolegnia parasitica CBS 223.65]